LLRPSLRVPTEGRDEAISRRARNRLRNPYNTGLLRSLRSLAMTIEIAKGGEIKWQLKKRLVLPVW